MILRAWLKVTEVRIFCFYTFIYDVLTFESSSGSTKNKARAFLNATNKVYLSHVKRLLLYGRKSALD
jgi:hypothetical protein